MAAPNDTGAPPDVPSATPVDVPVCKACLGVGRKPCNISHCPDLECVPCDACKGEGRTPMETPKP